MKRSDGQQLTRDHPAIKAASSLSRSRPIPCHKALALAALLLAPGAAEAFQQDSFDTDQESAKVEFRHTASAHRLVRTDEDRSSMPVSGMRMSEQLADNVALLFDRFGRSEFILCLEGEINEAGEMVLRDFRMPHIAFSRSTSAAVHPEGGCDQYDGIVATLHNHPSNFPKVSGRESKNCYLSHLDITSWLEYSRYDYTAVMCGPNTWAWWHRSQVKEEALIVFPVEGQLLLGGKPAAVTVH